MVRRLVSAAAMGKWTEDLDDEITGARNWLKRRAAAGEEAHE